MIVKDLITDQDKLVETKLFDVKKNLGLASAIRQDLTDTIETLDDRIFLCSNEIGRDERAFILKFKDGIRVYFNPAYIKRDKIFINREIDILTGKEYFIPRWSNVSIAYQDEDGEFHADKMNEVASVIVNQAMNLLDGIFASDIGLEILPEFDEMTEDDKKEILAGYIEELKDLGNKMDDDLSGDSETHDQWSAAKFIQGVADGTIKTEADPPSNNEQKRWKKLLKSIRSNEHRNKFWNKLRRKK